MSASPGPAEPSRPSGPLAGLRIVDLTRLAPGPYATMLLGDLGADVVTIERPGDARAGADPASLPGHGGAAAREQGINPLFRSRRCITLDLKSEFGRDVVLRLVDRADVFIEGFRPGVCDRLGLGYAELAARCPQLVYCSITGYGQQGPSTGRAGHDLNYLAEAGLLSVTTRPPAAPGLPLNILADHAAGGMVAAFGILAALRSRDRTGRGCHVDVSMFDGVLSMLAPAAAWVAAGAPDPSWGGGIYSGAAPFYDCYRTSDDRWLAVAAIEAKFFAALCAAIDRADLTPWQFARERWPALRQELQLTFASAPLAEWLIRLGHLDAAVSPVLTVPEAFARAAQSGDVTEPAIVGPLPRLSGFATSVDATSAQPDEHRDAILREVGLDPASQPLPDQALDRSPGTP